MSDERFQYWVADGELFVQCPYDHEWVAVAKRIGGRWAPSQKAWHFDLGVIDQVRETLEEVFVTIGDFPEIAPPPAAEGEITIRLVLSNDGIGAQREVKVAGRLIARRPGRDRPVVLGPGVRVVDGEFASRAGSSPSPLIIDDGSFGRQAGSPVTVDVLRVPIEQLERYQQYGGQLLNPQQHDLEQLQARREKLRTELAELDQQIAATRAAIAGEQDG